MNCIGCKERCSVFVDAEAGPAELDAAMSPQMRALREDRRCGYTILDIATEYGVSTGTVSDILTGRNWSSLPDE